MAARALFLEQGYQHTTMDQVAEKAGVSKATLYAYYPGKRELFAQIVIDYANNKWNSLRAITDDPVMSLSEKLHQAAKVLISSGFQPETCQFFQIVLAAIRDFPELGRIVNTQRQHPIDLVRRLLEDATHRGEIDCPDPQGYAIAYLDLMRGDRMMGMLLDPAFAPDLDTVLRQAELGIALFLKAIQPAR